MDHEIGPYFKIGMQWFIDRQIDPFLIGMQGSMDHQIGPYFKTGMRGSMDRQIGPYF